MCAKIRFRPEIALTRLQLAELLLDPSTSSGQGNTGQRAEALEHLDFAIAEFREMKMQPSLERQFPTPHIYVPGGNLWQSSP